MLNHAAIQDKEDLASVTQGEIAPPALSEKTGFFNKTCAGYARIGKMGWMARSAI